MRKSLWLSPVVLAVVALAFVFGPSLAEAGGKKAAQKAAQAKQKKKDKKKDKKAGQLEVVFKKLDADKDSKVSKTEFAKLKEVRQAIRAEKGKQAKKAKNADAQKKAKKAGKAGKKAGKRLDQLFDKLDANKDSFLTLDEFKKLKEVTQELKKAKAK